MVSFGQLWVEEYDRRHRPEDAEAWNERASSAPGKFGPGAYSEDFLALAALRDGESVFDMGCGAGSLAIPCARQGRRVLAADFSSVMLEQLRDQLDESTEGLVQTKLLSWDDDWRAAGIKGNSFDVAFASRSIATKDLHGALEKLSWVARRRVCTTVTPGLSPRVNAALVRDLGIPGAGHLDAAFVFAIASQMGFAPEVSYIVSSRYDVYATAEDAHEDYARMLKLCDWVDDDRKAALALQVHAWVDAHLVRYEKFASNNPGAEFSAGGFDIAPTVCINAAREMKWAFIAWDVN